jgi:SpoVK/Ycf46/Vps4 family AAA+-type ATPase
MPLLQWHIKSTTKAQQGLYEYDAVSRLRDSQLGRRQRQGQGHPQLHRAGRAVAGLHGRAAGGAADRRDRQGRHRVPERPAARTRPHGVLRLRDARTGQGAHRPIVFITSNNEKELPDAFLRRCFFHYIKFPDAETMQKIVDVHFPGLKKELLGAR